MKIKNKYFEDINSFVDNFLKTSLSGRYQEVIRCRYGLDGATPETLQSIGNKYGITRERVRQIEALALENLFKASSKHSNLVSFMTSSIDYLKSIGGIQEEGALLAYFKNLLSYEGDETRFSNSIRFVMELSGKLSRHSDNYDKDWKCYWYTGKTDEDKAKKFVGKLISHLNSKRDLLLSGKNFDEMLIQSAKQSNVKDLIAKNYLGISKKFIEGPFGHFGLSGWAEINPRTARDWAYAILKKEKKPLHFTDLYSLISTHRVSKKTNLQTVHNELIKDNRFVLVGRGLYGLKEHGLIPGTAKEIISHFIKKHGPLTAKEVINLVKDQRMIKDTTIMINLQNRDHFHNLGDGKYDIKEA